MSESSVKDGAKGSGSAAAKVWTDAERIAEQRKCIDLHISIENSHQLDRLIPETFAKEGVYYHVVPGLVDYQGHEGVLDFYDNLVKVLPDLHTTFIHEYDLPCYSFREGQFTGTHSAEFAGIPASGRKVGCPFMAIYIFKPDDPTKMIAERVYWDNTDLMRQMRGEVTMSEVLPWHTTM